MAVPTIAAPTRPAPMPQPSGLACAWVLDDAIVPVTARVASARAANLVLIDMEVSILCEAAIVVRMPSWTERVRKRFENVPGNMVSSFISSIFQIVTEINPGVHGLRRNNSGSNL